jgi:pimeloyl-ACP methyl ester carboxylesterase
MNKVLLYQNKKIFYRIIGSGKHVMLIHGFGEDGNIWNSQSEYLKDKFKLIIPDLPGSGKSEMIDDMSMEGMAEVIKSILDTEASPNPSQGGALESSKLSGSLLISESKVPPCGGFRGVLIGHSMGGYILLAFAEKYGNHLNAFGLFHSTAYADSEEKKAARRKGIDFINQHGAFEFLKTATPNLFSQKTKDERPELISELIAGLDNFSPAALVSYYEAMMQRPDRTDILQKATVPVLFIMGKYDNAIPLEDGLQQCHLPEKSYIYVLRNSGHMGMLEEKDKCNEILDKFLREI